VRWDADGDAVAWNHLDAEAAHAALGWASKFMAGIALR
jgi:hypothetical protein